MGSIGGHCRDSYELRCAMITIIFLIAHFTAFTIHETAPSSCLRRAEKGTYLGPKTMMENIYCEGRKTR